MARRRVARGTPRLTCCLASADTGACRQMTRCKRGSRVGGAAVSLVGTSAVAVWALAHAPGKSAPAVGLAAVAGVVMFAATLTSPLAPLRNRAIGTGVVLLGTASVIGATADAFATRAAVMVISGGVLFCAAEVADRSVAAARHVEHLPGVDRWSPAWVLGVAAGSAGLSYRGRHGARPVSRWWTRRARGRYRCFHAHRVPRRSRASGPRAQR